MPAAPGPTAWAMHSIGLEGAGGNDTITGNDDTQIGFDDALSGVTVTFSSVSPHTGTRRARLPAT